MDKAGVVLNWGKSSINSQIADVDIASNILKWFSSLSLHNLSSPALSLPNQSFTLPLPHDESNFHLCYNHRLTWGGGDGAKP